MLDIWLLAQIYRVIDPVVAPVIAEQVPAVMAMAYAAASGALVMPLVQWLKQLTPGDIPLQATFYSLVLSALAAWGIAAWLAPDLSKETLVLFVLAGDKIAAVAHAGAKTVAKNEQAKIAKLNGGN